MDQTQNISQHFCVHPHHTHPINVPSSMSVVYASHRVLGYRLSVKAAWRWRGGVRVGGKVWWEGE